MTNIVNLTPHTINFVGSDGAPLFDVAPSGKIARVSTDTVTIGSVNGIPVTDTQFGQVTDLPDPIPGTVFVVSLLVAQRAKGRDDVFVPAESVRDAQGRIVGCKSLGRVH